MDTNLAITIIQTESDNLGADIGVKTNLQKALDLAVQLLQGTLTTQLTELEDAKAQLTTLQDASDTVAEVIAPAS